MKSGRYMDIFSCQNMRNNKNKHSGRVSCSACDAFFYLSNFVSLSLFTEVSRCFLFLSLIDS